MIALRQSAWSIGSCLLTTVGLSGCAPHSARPVPPSVLPASWRTETVDEIFIRSTPTDSLSSFKRFQSLPVSLALDEHDSPHISYVREGRLVHAFRDAGSWTTEAVDHIDANPHSSLGMVTNLTINNCQIAVADSGVHIAYSSGAELRYALKSHGVWSTMVVDDSAAAAATVALALDVGGTPHISYGCTVPDPTTPGFCDAAYAVRASHGWRTTRVGSNVGERSSLFVDGNVPHVVLSIGPGFQYRLRYATEATDWSIETITDRGGENAAIAVDSNGRPHVAWAGPGAVRHAWRVGASDWKIAEFPDPAEPSWSLIAVAIDSEDNVHVAHCHDSGLRYLVHRNSGEWHVETVDADAVGPFPFVRLSLVLDHRGQPHIGYVGVNPLRLSTQLVKYAYRSP